MSYTVQVSNDKYSNLAYADQIYSLTIKETVGNLLPMFKLSFRDQDFSKLQYLNELSPITLGYMVEDQLISNQFIIKQKKPVIQHSSFDCAISGYLNVFNYLKGVPAVPYVTGTSLEAIQQIASAYFNSVQASEFTTEDTMTWLHNGMNARNFIQDIWKHMYSPDSLPMIGICLDGTFKIQDLINLVAQEPKYYFSHSLQEGYELYINAYTSDDSLDNTSNYGYTSERTVIKEGTLEETVSSVSPEVVMTTSNQMNEQQDIPTRQLAPMFQSLNVHEHWYEAHHQNLVRWSSLNNNTATWVLYNNILDLSLMDLVYLDLPEDDTSGKSSDGLYIVSSREITFDGLGNATIKYTGIREVAQNTYIAEAEDTSEDTTSYSI